MYITHKKLVLASASPRRQQFFNELGLSFVTQVAKIDETPQPKEAPEPYVMRLASSKAMAVACDMPDSWVVGADTIVCLEGTLLGKPVDEAHALAMLMSLSGKKHEVVTAFSLVCVQEGINIVEAVSTEVYFRSFTEDFARSYIKTGEPMDKAGAYGIQALGGVLVERINGSYSTVVGLPLVELCSCLEYNGVIGVAGIAQTK